MTNAARESRVAQINPSRYLLAMNLAEVEKQALP